MTDSETALREPNIEGRGAAAVEEGPKREEDVETRVAVKRSLYGHPGRILRGVGCLDVAGSSRGAARGAFAGGPGAPWAYVRTIYVM